MTRIALLRHFPTAWNRERRLQGQADIPLSEDARTQLTGLHMPAPWDRARIVASPLIRAAETARLLSGGRAIALDARLVEISWGDWEGRLAEELLADPHIGFRPTHEWTGDDRAPGGESPDEALTRALPTLAEIASAGSDTVVVTHKALMRLILRRAGVAQPEIKRGRLYPLSVGRDGALTNPGDPVRLVPR